VGSGYEYVNVSLAAREARWCDAGLTGSAMVALFWMQVGIGVVTGTWQCVLPPTVLGVAE
jgi:hypothetical protein